MNNLNLITIFLTGLLTGGLSCMAVQGGLLAATLINEDKETQKERSKKKESLLPIIAFLIAKLVAYTILGFLLGILGSFLNLSITAKVIMQVVVAVFMFGTAGNLLNIHPVFRYFVIQPPKFLFRLVKNKSKSNSLFAPIIVGAFTIFIPCGITQAMMALAISGGNGLLGAGVMFSFILGTSPVFFILGYLTTKLENKLHDKFLKIAAIAIVIIAIINLNAGIAITGSKFTLENIWKKISCSTILVCDINNSNNNSTKTNKPSSPLEEITVTIERNKYNPDYLEVKKGSKITLHVINNNGYGCIQAFTIPSLNIQKVIPPGSSETFIINTPNYETEIAFMCSMGMYRGVIKVL